MSSRKEHINSIRKILNSVDAQLEIEGEFNWPFYEILMDTIFAIEKEKIYELVPDLYKLLEHPLRDIREEVVYVLGLITRLHVPEFRDRAFQIWLEDKDNMVKEAALHVWATYYLGTKNANALKVLYDILVDESYPVDFRSTAMQEIFTVTQEPSNFYDPFQSRQFFDHKLTHEKLNALIDWKEIEGIMKKHAPEALN